MQNDLKYELQNVLSGKSQVRFGTIIQTVASYLKDGEKTSSAVEDAKRFKSEETERLEDYVTQNNFWANEIDSYWSGFAIRGVRRFFVMLNLFRHLTRLAAFHVGS